MTFGEQILANSSLSTGTVAEHLQNVLLTYTNEVPVPISSFSVNIDTVVLDGDITTKAINCDIITKVLGAEILSGSLGSDITTDPIEGDLNG